MQRLTITAESTIYDVNVQMYVKEDGRWHVGRKLNPASGYKT